MHYIIKSPNFIKNAYSVNQSSPLKTYEQGFYNGKNEGFQKGKEAGRAEINLVKERLEPIVEALIKEKEDYIKSLEPHILKLIKLIAEKVIAKEVTKLPSGISLAVTQALNKIAHPDKILLKVNPQDVKQVESIRDQWLSRIKGVSNFQIIPDDGISPGGCLAETPRQILDATIDSKIQNVAKILGVK